MTNFLRRIFILFNSGQNPERSVVRPALPFGRATKMIRELKLVNKDKFSFAS